ncbi:DsbA family protein [Chondromyces crocatus]|uniref:DSBA-like thioredoxin domain-containing protein n=1 Tax=Chondromyces crocatus TaxID=52 RepID=A0A0K1EEW4_CHOCO|nr:hypothetical protein [Chondromyces crocatus]AKT39098.1 uncharacterized protein CMC5_032450 [Chondromyces crocatus]
MSEPFPHPSFAKHLRELSVDFLLENYHCLLHTPVGVHGYPRLVDHGLQQANDMPSLLDHLAAQLRVSGDFLGPQALEEVMALHATLASTLAGGEDPERAVERWIQQIGAVLMREEGHRPYDPGKVLQVQLSLGGDGLRVAMAIARHGLRKVQGRATPPQLPAPLIPRKELPALGTGPIEVIEVVDPCSGYSIHAHPALQERLNDVLGQVQYRFMHGLTGHKQRESELFAGLIEAVAEACPDRFWQFIERFHAWRHAGDLDELTALLIAFGLDVDQVRARALQPDVVEKIWRDTRMVRSCAIPPLRPVVVVGRELFVGELMFPYAIREIEKRAQAASL